MKKSLRLLVYLTVIAVMILALSMSVYAESSTGTLTDDISWTMDEEGNLEITGTGAIPDYGNGFSELAVSPFRENSEIKSVVIGDGITTIGMRLFAYCGGIESVSFPDTLKDIRDYAFYDNKALTSVSFPDGLESIGFESFAQCVSIKEVKLPDNVTLLGEGAFRTCLQLRSFKFPAKLETIPANTLAANCRLRSVEIPDGIRHIEAGAFTSCFTLKTITIPKSVETIGCYAFQDCAGMDEIIFEGDFPDSEAYCINTYNELPLWFYSCSLTARYPLGNSTWTEDATGWGYGGKVKWVGYCITHDPDETAEENIKEATALKTGSYDEVVYCKICGEEISRQKVTIPKLKATIKLSATRKTIKKGVAYTLKVTGLAKGDSVKSFKSSKKGVATVTSKGKIKARKKGKAVITVALKSGKTAKCTITVK